MAKEEKLLADGTPNPAYKEEGQGGEPGAGDGKGRTFTQEELDKTISERLAREQKKVAADLEAATKKAREEALAEAKLSEEEKVKKQREKEAQEAQERDNRSTIRENRLDALEEFVKVELPKELVDFVVDLDKEKQTEKIASLKTAFDTAVEKKVADKTKGEPPPDPQKPGKDAPGVRLSF